MHERVETIVVILHPENQKQLNKNKNYEKITQDFNAGIGDAGCNIRDGKLPTG